MRTFRYNPLLLKVYHYILLCLMLLPIAAGGQTWQADSWETVQKKGKGTITILWCDIEPFIYLYKDSLTGVEYELMEGFPAFLKDRYHVDVRINWVRMPSFESIYPAVKQSQQKGLFAVSYFSITAERKQEVHFSPPYMPDLNVIVTGTDLPVYEQEQDFIGNLHRMRGFTMKETTMEDDMHSLLQQSPRTPVTVLPDDYEVMNQIALHRSAFGYVPLSMYIIALQRGVKIKRQKVLTARREGLAAIYTRHSDWNDPVEAYFNSSSCKSLTRKLIHKHLGAELAQIIVQVSAPDSIRSTASDIELLTREREIVAERFINSALQVQRERFYRNITIAAAAALLILLLILLNRFRTKRKYNRLLQQRNDLILQQKQEIERINDKLEQKLILSQLNPHLIFNSLTAVQHFVMLDDKKTANQYLVLLSRFVRQILQNAEAPMIRISKEGLMLEQYLALEQARFGLSFDYTVHIPDNCSQGNIPSMLIFPFVEQVLYKRVLKSKMADPKRTIGIYFGQEEQAYTISIRDNVVLPEQDVPAGELSAEQSVRLAEEQVALLNKYNRNKIILKRKQSDSGRGQEIQIIIPDNLSI